VAQTVVAAKGHTPGPDATATTPQVCTVCGETLKEAGQIDKFHVVLGENFAIVVKKSDKILSADDVEVKIANADGLYYTYTDFVVDLEENTITIKGITAVYLGRSFQVIVAGGKALTVSADMYCNAAIGAATTDIAVKAVCQQMQTYSDMAENYFRGTANEAVVDEYDAGDAKRVVSNNGSVKFYSAYLSLEDGVYMMVAMQDYNGEAVTVLIDGKATTAYTIEEIGGKSTIVLAVKANLYDSELTFSVAGSTLTYSVDAYIKSKQNDTNQALVDLVNALGNYGKAVRDFNGDTAKDNNQTEDDIL
jgi:hypothetical protein